MRGRKEWNNEIVSASPGKTEHTYLPDKRRQYLGTLTSSDLEAGITTKEEILTRLSVLLGSQYERIVQFAESIPGFGDFSKEDQRILLQIGGLEVILLQLSQIYDHKSKLLRVWEGMWLSPEQARKLTSDFNLAVFFELLFSLAESLHGMHLREEDIAVFSALLLLASDLQGLKQKMQVEALQDKVLSGFAYMLSQNHRCKPNLLPQVLMCMPTLRTISTSYLELTAVPRHTMVAPPPPDSTAMAMRLF
ncbi:nuclear receptor ROR-alpha-like [Lytechinus pictus]|uniref:nuclear receptor ROR-alpha-like n=1 Tax=Lytechinus pictus TaxID=7653 RepID=UPI0030B9F8E0